MNVKDLTLAHVKSHLQASSTSWSIIFTCMHSCIYACCYLNKTYFYVLFYILLASDHSKTKGSIVASDQVHLVIFFSVMYTP
jgi:hypothetical protein